MVLIGIINTIRIGIGIQRIWINLLFGSLTYLFLGFSGLLVKELILIKNDSSYKGLLNYKQVIIIFGIIFSLSIGFMVFHVYGMNLDLNVMILFIIMGLIWLGSWLFTKYYNKNNIIVKLIENICFTFGILYGAALNTSFIPIFVYFFFITAFSSQLSRDFTRIKKFKIRNTNKNHSEKSNNSQNNEIIEINKLEKEYGSNKVLKISLIFQILSIIFLISSFFTDLYSPLLYLYAMVIAVSFLVISSILCIKGIFEDKNRKIIGILIKIGIAFELIAFALANF